MRQYASFKAAHPDCILFFRMGDFYEMFDDDAKAAHSALGITLTERSSGIPMAGVPFHAAENYLRRLIEQGFRVAVCEQVQDPKDAKGVVERAVTRVITPGTLVDDSLLDDGVANEIASIASRDADGRPMIDIAVAELSTGAFRMRSVPFEEAVDELVRLHPSELLHRDDDDDLEPLLQQVEATIRCARTPRPGWNFETPEAARLLRDHWGVHSLDGFGLEDADPDLGAAGSLLCFLKETQAGHESAAGLRHLQPPRREARERFMSIDAATLRSLEVEQTMRSGSTEGSLLATMQSCRTPMGRRALRHWLCHPLTERSLIERRLDVVQILVDDEQRRGRIRTTLELVQDIARISARVAMRRVTPRDFWALGRSLSSLPELIELTANVSNFESLQARLLDAQQTLGPLGDRIRLECNDDPPAHLREGGFFRDGIDPELDEARSLQSDGNSWLAIYQQQLSEETGIPTLKVGYNKVFGYYIEVTHAHTERVPIHFNRKQTLKNAERYITAELKEYEDKVIGAERRAIERERILFDALCHETEQVAAAITDCAEAVSELDVLGCFAEFSARTGGIRPVMLDDRTLDIEAGRHPVLDALIGSEFVPNDTRLAVDGDTQTLALITGPNMAGKSTYIRQVALLTLLAHVGCYLPATRARIGCVDRIFTRIGASDELHTGRSTFMIEMMETANILHHATERSLVILDEIGRGTSTLDGLSLAWAITEALAERGARTFFATHYHELTALADQQEAIGNLHVAVREWKDRIVFLHHIEPGSTDRSYGQHVAQLAGVPASVIERSRSLLDTLSVQTTIDAPPPPPPTSTSQFGLFSEPAPPHPAIEELRELQLDSMTPLAAFDALRRLVERAREN